MPCGVVASEEVMFDIPGSTGKQTVLTNKKDKRSALQKIEEFMMMKFQGDFFIKLNDGNAADPNSAVACSTDCPNRVYLMGVTYNTLDAQNPAVDGPTTVWDIVAKGKYNLAIYCVKDSQTIEPIAANAKPIGVKG